GLVAPIILASAGALAAGAGGMLLYWGKRDNTQLNQCSPTCPMGAPSHVHTMFLAGDIALGAGAVSLSAAVWLFVGRGGSRPAAPKRGADASTTLSLAPTAHGGVAGVSGKF